MTTSTGPAQTIEATTPLRVLVAPDGVVTAPAAPRELTVQFDYPATLQGSTQHFTVYYDPSLGGDGATIAAGVLQTCEQDYARVSAWFGGINLSSMNVIIAPGISGAYHHGCSGTDLYCGARTGPVDVNYTRFVLMAEVVEVFSAAQGGAWNCGASNGEGLSRVLATQLYPAEAAGFATAPKWLDGGQPDWIDNTDSTDLNPVSTGCATLFLNWLHYELGYSWRQIVGAAAPTLAGTYANLTSRPDGFLSLVRAKFPAGSSGLNGDNAFPLWSQFAEFTLVGQAYQWAYDPSTGLVAIVQINQAGVGFTETYAGIWDTGFTGFTAVELDGQAYVWAYRASDGRVCIHQINPGGAGFTQTAYIATWDTGYTAFAPIQLDGLAFVWAYRQSDGRVCIHQIDAGGTGFTQTGYIPVWDTGYTAFQGIELAGQAYVWAYRASNGWVCIHQINAGGTGFTQVYISTAD